MKICPKCKKTYTDDLSFCITCGCSLNEKKSSQKRSMIIAIIIVLIIAEVGIGLGISEQKRINNNRKEIEDYQYQKALEEYRNTPTISDLRVENDWTTETMGNYLFIRGTVKNTSYSKTISYYEVEVKFYDRYGNVVDSDWTNSAKELSPGESRKFEIMHKYSSDEKDFKLSVKDVR